MITVCQRTILLGPLLAGLLLTAFAAQARESSLLTRARPGVATINTYSVNGLPLRTGSAFAVDKKGTLVTNLHIVADAGVVEVTTDDGRTLYASAVRATSKQWDLALLQIEPGELKPLPLAKGKLPDVDDPVHVVGSTVTLDNELFSGIVTDPRGKETGVEDEYALLQISNQIYAETSGAPVISNRGKVVGVVVHGGLVGDELSYMVPIEVVKELLASTTDATPEQRLGELTDDVKSVLEQALAPRRQMLSECEADDVASTDSVIREAISLGAPAYNAGNFLACFRLYEGASYKLLYLLGERCPTATSILGEAVLRASQEEGVTDKAWAMRFGFDAILGQPTQRGRPRVDPGPAL